jgi:hypothetical protein
MSDPIEKLARALFEAGGASVGVWDVYPAHAKAPWIAKATALYAQIAPTLRAEGMEMAATKIEAGIPMLRNCGMVDVADMMQGTADEIRAEAARLREGGVK